VSKAAVSPDLFAESAGDDAAAGMHANEIKNLYFPGLLRWINDQG
jgi:hypothetical protein